MATPKKQADITDVAYTTVETARYLNISSSTLANARVSGRLNFPPYFKVGGAIRYLKSDLDEFVENSKRESTSKGGGTT